MNNVIVDKSQWYKLPHSFVEVWRDVNEKLPEEGELVLITLRDQINMANVAGYSKSGSPIWIAYGGYHLKPSLVSAWMPLPKPYVRIKEGEDADSD